MKRAASAASLLAFITGAAEAAPVPSAPEQVKVVVARSRTAVAIDQRTRELQNVPRAATRINAQQLAAEHATSLTEVARLIPTLQVDSLNPLNTQINIRGLGANGTTSTAGLEGGVATYVDDVYRARPASIFNDIPDLVGIDVLRGPAGTEGGESATAGAVDLQTARPEFTPAYEAEQGVGNYGWYRWLLDATGPIGSGNTLAYRMSVLGLGNTGWITNREEDGHFYAESDRAFRGQVLWTPQTNLTVRLIADYSHLVEAAQAFGLTSALTHAANGAPLSGTLFGRDAAVGYTPLPFSSAPYEVDYNSPNWVSQEDEGLSADVAWTTGGVTLRSITAYRAYNWDPRSDADALGVSEYINNSQKLQEHQATQEFRATGRWDNIADWTVGTWYMWQENDIGSRTVYGLQTASWLGDTTAAQRAALNGLTTVGSSQPTTNNYATYGNTTWHLAPRLDLLTGLRFDYDTKAGSFNERQSGTGSLLALPPALAAAAQSARNTLAPVDRIYGRLDNGFVTGNANLSYHVTDALLAYVRYAHGAKSGGLNLGQLPAGIAPIVRAETDDSVEIGEKWTALHGRLLVDAALYNIEDHNYQAPVLGLLPSGLLTSFYGNAKLAQSRGAEIDAHLSPVAGLVLSASGDYDDATYRSYHQAACPPELSYRASCDLTGTTIPFIPKWAFALSAEYEQSLAPLGLPRVVGQVGGSYRWSSAINTTTNNAAEGWVGSYGTLNLNAGVKWRLFELDAFIDNATDVRHLTLITQEPAVSSAFGGIVTEPLNFGFILKEHF